ncbi:MAG: peptidoglycan-binding protein [Methylococcaceae bacterium]
MSLTDFVEVPNSLNQGITNARQQTMLALLGSPRGRYSNECQPVTHPVLSSQMVTDSVGTFRATGLLPAIEDLKVIMAAIKREQPDVHAALGTAGMLCARLVRGSTSIISNHSWGTAIDLTLDGKLDRRGDNKVYKGLTKIAPIFNQHGWYWGAGFRTEDAMHFEVGDERIRKWHSEGRFGVTGVTLPETALSLGDRGPEVRELQEKLNQTGTGLKIDGEFGPLTHAAVVAFQAGHGLRPDGVVGPKTRAALGL